MLRAAASARSMLTSMVFGPGAAGLTLFGTSLTIGGLVSAGTVGVGATNLAFQMSDVTMFATGLKALALDDDENPSGCKTLTVGSFLICKHGGILSPFNSGQEREVEVGEFEEGQRAYDRVMNFKFENEIKGEEDDLLYEMQGEEGIDSIMDGLKALIPQKVDNATALTVYDMIAGIPIFEKRIKNNAAHNLEEFAKDSTPLSNGYIENQNEWGNIWFGSGSNHNMMYSGCEIIATYNALRALGNGVSEKTMVELISSYERNGAALMGEFGVAPNAIAGYFKEQGYSVNMTKSTNWSDINAFVESSGTVIATVYNNKYDLTGQVHTVSITKENGQYVVHNGYNKDESGSYMESEPYATVAEAIMNMGGEKAAPLSIIGISR